MPGTGVRSCRTAVTCVALIPLLAACTGVDEPRTVEASAGSSRTATPDVGPSSPKAAAAPSSAAADSRIGDGAVSEPFAADLRPDMGEGRGSAGELLGVRTGTQEGYDRVVFDFSGPGTPRWQVEYTDRPEYETSGEPVAVAGDSVLAISLGGVGTVLGSETTPGTGRVVRQVVSVGAFEGVGEVFIGLTGPRRPFRVFSLTDPARLVVDVREQ